MAAGRRGRQSPWARRQLLRQSAQRAAARGRCHGDGRRRRAAASRAGRVPTCGRSCASPGTRIARPPRRCEGRSCSPRAARRPSSDRRNGGSRTWRDARCATPAGSSARFGGCSRCPSCEVLEVVLADGGGELLVPLVSDAVQTVDIDRREIVVDVQFLGSRLMEIDVFTLFPDAFSWFERQRHIAQRAGPGQPAGLCQLPRSHAAQRRSGG